MPLGLKLMPRWSFTNLSRTTAVEVWVDASVGSHGNAVGCGNSTMPCGTIGFALRQYPNDNLDVVLVQGSVFSGTFFSENIRLFTSVSSHYHNSYCPRSTMTAVLVRTMVHALNSMPTRSPCMPF